MFILYTTYHYDTYVELRSPYKLIISFQVATFFDQNHESNHKNSMIGQSVIIEVDVGDKVQVFSYTITNCSTLTCKLFILLQDNCFYTISTILGIHVHCHGST